MNAFAPSAAISRQRAARDLEQHNMIDGSQEARAEALIGAMQQIATMAGTPQQVGISETDVDRLADDAMTQTRLLGNRAREMTRDNALAIYAAAL
jgi:alcohol dehydrogenase